MESKKAPKIPEAIGKYIWKRQELSRLQVLLNGVQVMTTLVIVGVLEAVAWNPNLNTILVQSLLCSSKALWRLRSARILQARSLKPEIEPSVAWMVSG